MVAETGVSVPVAQLGTQPWMFEVPTPVARTEVQVDQVIDVTTLPASPLNAIHSGLTPLNPLAVKMASGVGLADGLGVGMAVGLAADMAAGLAAGLAVGLGAAAVFDTAGAARTAVWLASVSPSAVPVPAISRTLLAIAALA